MAIRHAEHSLRYNLHMHGYDSPSAQRDGLQVVLDGDIINVMVSAGPG